MSDRPKLKVIKGLGGVGKLPAEKFSRLRPVTFPASLSR